MDIKKLNESMLEIESIEIEQKIKLMDYIRINYDYLVDVVILKLQQSGQKPYAVLSRIFKENGYEKVNEKALQKYFSIIKKEQECKLGNVKKSIVPSRKELFYRNQEELKWVAKLDKSTLNSSLHSTQSTIEKSVTPTLEESKPVIEKEGLPISVEVVSTPQNVVAAVAQKRMAVSRDDPIHMELPPGLTAEEQEKVARWYDIAWIGEEPDWTIYLSKDYYKTLFTAKWDDEKENIWRHVLKMAREKYGMTESELTTATYFQRKSTKELADLRGGLANIRARNDKKYQLSPFREGKITRKAEGV